MGTMLFQLGLDQGEPPERWNLEHPDVVARVHRDYIAAGAQIILTNTFGANRRRLHFHGLEGQVDGLVLAASRIARSEADRVEQPVLVAGSIGPTGSFLDPIGDLDFDEAVDIYREQSRSLLEGGVDVFWIETMYSLDEVEASVRGCRDTDESVPIITTMTFDMAGRTMMGTRPEEAVQRLNELGVVSLGGNCGNGPAEVERAIGAMVATDPDAVLVAKSNAGIPHIEGGVPVYDASPEVMARHALSAAGSGARIIGACCGSTPDHIRAMASALQDGSGPA